MHTPNIPILSPSSHRNHYQGWKCYCRWITPNFSNRYISTSTQPRRL